MNIFIFFPAFLVFIYTLYKSTKDDYVLIKKNISPEQIFDIAFMATWISLLFSRLIFFVFYPQTDKDILVSFFTLRANEFSLSGLILGGIICVYLFSKYKKFPTKNLIDFFVAAFAVSLPVGIFSFVIFFREYELLLYFLNGLVYAIFAYYLVRYIKSKFASFLLFFSFVSLINSICLMFIKNTNIITIENALFIVLILVCIVLLLKRK